MHACRLNFNSKILLRMLHCCVASNVLHMQHTKMLHAPCNINYGQPHATYATCCICCGACCCNTVGCCRLMQQKYRDDLMLAKMVAVTTRRIAIRPKCKLLNNFPLSNNVEQAHIEFIGQKVLFIWRQVIFNNRIMK